MYDAGRSEQVCAQKDIRLTPESRGVRFVGQLAAG